MFTAALTKRTDDKKTKLQAIIAAAIDKAIAGDVVWARLILEYAYGKPIALEPEESTPEYHRPMSDEEWEKCLAKLGYVKVRTPHPPNGVSARVQ
jgi:hypothetical protein